MRQIWIEKTGSPAVLKMQTAPEPIPRSGELRIRVEACGVSFSDLMGRMGLDKLAPSLPFVPGFEISGVIDQVAQGVPDFKEGDAVVAFTPYGGYCDVICVSHHLVFKRLDWMSIEDAAALPVNYTLAYAMLVQMGALNAGNQVLIHNAGGGLGLAALDICKILGAETFGTASPEKKEFLEARGLNHFIDYRNYDYERELLSLTNDRGVDIVLDPLGGIHWPKNYRLLKPSGRVIHCGTASMVTKKVKSRRAYWRGEVMLPLYTPRRLMRENKAVLGISLQNLWENDYLLRSWMKQIIAWYDEALFRPHIHQVFRLEEAAEAHDLLHERKNIGKLLLRP